MTNPINHKVYKRIVFLGDFKDLKKQGYKFIKCFARNYKCYTKTSGEYASDSVDIWVKDKLVEINGNFSASWLLLKTILENREVFFTQKSFTIKGKECFHNGYVALRYNIETGEVKVEEDRKALQRLLWKTFDEDEEEYDRLIKLWPERVIGGFEAKEIMRLWDAGLLRVEEIPEDS